MIARVLPNPGLTLLLTLLWLMLNNTLSVGQVLLGLVLGLAIPLLVQGFLIDLPKVRRPLKLCLFSLKDDALLEPAAEANAVPPES